MLLCSVRTKQLNKANQTAAAAHLTPEEEMTAFKWEIYDELAEINKMNPASVFSNSVHITEDGFKRMKDDRPAIPQCRYDGDTA